MGAIFELPVLELAEQQNDSAPHRVQPGQAHPPGLIEVLQELRSNGFRCVAAHPHTTMKTVWEGQFKTDTCILFGSEGHGITPELLDACDEQLAIPMAPNVDSLNVAAAAAVFLYEVQRQRAH